MDRFSIKEVIEMALQTEKLGYKFYSEMTARFKDNKGLAELFTTLGTMELRHEQIFADLLAKVEAAGETPEPEGWEEAQNYLRAMVESEFFLGNEKSLPSLEHVKTVRDAADFALSFEKETMLFFIGIRPLVADKGPVQEIIDEEGRHIAWLSRFRSAL